MPIQMSVLDEGVHYGVMNGGLQDNRVGPDGMHGEFKLWFPKP